MLIFSAEPQNHVNVVLLALLLNLLKHIKCDSIEFCSVQKRRKNGHVLVCIYVYVYTHACVVICGEDGPCQEFTGREQGLVNTK
jgi:hypothetical protein